MTDDATNTGAASSPVDRGVGLLVPERGIAGMTNAELRAEIGRMQRELIRRVCGDPVQGVGLKVRPSYCNRGNHCPWTDGDPSFCRACGERAQGSGQ